MWTWERAAGAPATLCPLLSLTSHDSPQPVFPPNTWSKATQRGKSEARVLYSNLSLGPPATSTYTHTHTHTRKWGASPYKSVLRPWEDSYKSTKSERTLEIGQTPAHCFHSQDTHVFAWILLGHKAARLTREPAQYVCFLCSLDTAFPFCDGVQSILAASQVCNLTPSVAKDFKVKSHRNPTHCEHCSAEHRPDVCWLRWPEYRTHGKGSLGMEGKRGWASRKKGEDLKLEEDNEQHRDISRYKCRKTLSLLSIVT